MLRRGLAAPAPTAASRCGHGVKRSLAAPATAPILDPTARSTRADQKRRRLERAAVVVERTTPLPGKTLLQAESVSAATRAVYSEKLELVDAWAALQPHSPVTEADWDYLLSRLMDQMFLDGEAAGFGEKLLSAVTWMYPSLSAAGGGKMAMSRQALRGWRKIEPIGMRLPVPFLVVMMLVNHFVRQERREAALLAWLQTETYCRPSELFRLRPRDVIRALPGAGSGHRFTSLVLHPMETGLPSKTQEFDETVLLDLRRHRPLATALEKYAERRKDEGFLFIMSPGEFFAELAAAAEMLGIQKLGPLNPYRFRHTGASHDFATKERSLLEIQRRGRWRGKKSMRRYEKGGRLTELLQRLDTKTVIHAKRCGKCAGQVLLGARSPLVAP